MKTKRLSKKLFLFKETVSDLTNVQMGGVKGGRTLTDPVVCCTLEDKCSVYYTRQYTCYEGCPPCEPF